jgi:hypothetical protein
VEGGADMAQVRRDAAPCSCAGRTCARPGCAGASCVRGWAGSVRAGGWFGSGVPLDSGPITD